ncbi:hypothetical protein MNBD_NITROSPINAE01-871 [hydrothermal vent metagenome]|uniref:Uncharacterized protein n=1 Tax=hydrothermal vent metagenome TaxID=652676 RepID=A0A3B1CHY1_9ZZZZ
MSRGIFLCMALVATLASAGWINSATAAVPNASCSGCHKKNGPHTANQKIVNHAINVIYPVSNLNNNRAFKSASNIYLEGGKIVCRTCHDGYTAQLTTGTAKHFLTPSARGTLGCEACHNK